MKKIIGVLLLSSFFAQSSYAGMGELTWHSRANCGTNESVSWHAFHRYWFWTVGRHRHDQKRIDHQVIADWAYTWRSAPIHWTEGTGGWTVEGNHWMRDSENRRPHVARVTFVSDCNIYDGWWDHRE